MRRGSARPSVLRSQHPVGAGTLREGGGEMGGRKGEANWTVSMREDEKRIKCKVFPFKDLRTSERRQSLQRKREQYASPTIALKPGRVRGV